MEGCLVGSSKPEAQDWTRQNMHGVCDVIILGYRADLKRLNGTCIRHDVRKSLEYGYWAALLVCEAGTTLEEYVRFMKFAVDEARGRHHSLVHSIFNAPDDVVEIARVAEEIGLSGLLLRHDDVLQSVTMADVIEAIQASLREQGERATLLPPTEPEGRQGLPSGRPGYHWRLRLDGLSSDDPGWRQGRPR